MLGANVKHTINKSFFKLFIPTTIGNLAIVVMSLADVALTSHYYGANGLTVVTLFIPLLTLWGCIYEGVGIGAAALLAQSIGTRDKKREKEVVAESNSLILFLSFLICIIGLLASLFISAKELGISDSLFKDSLYYGRFMFIATFPIVFNNYLLFLVRTDSAPKIAGISNGIQVGLNIILDIFFMGYLNMGIKGAALAFLIATSSALIFTFFHLFSSRSRVKLIFSKPKLDFIKIVIPYSYNSIISNISDFITSLVVNILVLIVFGIEIASIIYIISYIVMFVVYCSMGLSYSVMPIIGVYIGEKCNEALKFLFWKSIKYGLFIGILLAVIIAMFPQEIAVYIFSFEYPTYYSLCDKAIRIYALSIPAYMINWMIICYCQQVGKFGLSLIITIISSSITLLLMIFFSLAVVNTDGLWWSFFVGEMITLILWFIYAKRQKLINSDNYFLCFKKIHNPNIDEFHQLLYADNIEKVKKYHSDVAKFLLCNRFNDLNIEKAQKIIKELVNLANLSKKRKRRIIDISISIISIDDFSINAKIDNGLKDFNSITEKDSLYKELKHPLCALKTLSNNGLQCQQILSFNTIDIIVSSKNNDI